MQRRRLRDLNLAVGDWPTGAHNAITDVSGVRVGHETIITDEPAVIRTGVTVIAPEDGHIWGRNLFGGAHVLNGDGEMTGLARLDEFGLIGGPVALTGTHSIGAVHEALVACELEADSQADFLLPTVAETFDGWLSDPAAFAVRAEHVRSALAHAAPGPVAEGNVGGGTGMITHEFKAGIGTASRCIGIAGEPWTLGVLVQTNYGRRHQLRLDGRPIGRTIPPELVPLPWPESRDQGSIIAVVATDAPLSSLQCRRLAQRAGLGVGRTGGTGAPASGDIFLAFSTANVVETPSEASRIRADHLPDARLEPLFEGVIEAVEESIWNALCAAETMTGRHGRTAHAIPLDILTDVVGHRTL